MGEEIAMSVIDKIRAKAMSNVKQIVLAEGSEPRTVQAARSITDLKIARVTLLGERSAKSRKQPGKRGRT